MYRTNRNNPILLIVAGLFIPVVSMVNVNAHLRE
jgi:hypothetical protein